MLQADSIPLFENLIQYEYEGHFYDFHNFYMCTQIKFASYELTFYFKNINSDETVLLRFFKVSLFDFIYVEPEKEGIQMNFLNRERFQKGNDLFEVNSDGDSFFCASFTPGLDIHFFSNSFELIKVK